MEIRNKSSHDAVSDLHITDAYMRWALEAAEEVAGKHGLGIVLRDAGLVQMIDHYPDDKVEVSGTISYGEYANLNAGLLTFFGRAAKSMNIRIGRISTRKAIDRQSALFGVAALIAAKMLPTPTKLKMGMEAQINGFKKLSEAAGETYKAKVEDRGEKLALIIETCAICAGKEADQAICYLYSGTLEESIQWLTGKKFDIREVECRALGAPACVWEVSKMPLA
jgi:predicted hydrocarbon binding protein